MSKGGKNKTYQRYDKNLIDRIDNMKTDADYNPYEATKKHTVTDQELFDAGLYSTPEEEEAEELAQDSSGGGVIALVVVLLVILVAAVGFVVFKVM